MRLPVGFGIKPDSVPSATVNRLFSIKPTSIKFTELRPAERLTDYGLTFTVDCSVPVIVSVFVKVKETLDKAHDITAEYLILTKPCKSVRKTFSSSSFSVNPKWSTKSSQATF